jgi:hypothetical protein
LDPDSVVRPSLNGYGFASAWRRRVADAVRFPDRDHGEDAEFVERVVNAGFQVRYAADVEGQVLHVMHQNNISRVLPQYVLPDFVLGKYFPGYARPAGGNGLAGLRRLSPRWSTTLVDLETWRLVRQFPVGSSTLCLPRHLPRREDLSRPVHDAQHALPSTRRLA